MKKLIIILISCYTFAIQSNVLSIEMGPSVLTINEVGCYQVPIDFDGTLYLTFGPPCQPFVTYTGEEILCVNAGPTPGVFVIVCLSEPPYQNLLQWVTVENILPVELTSFISIVNGSKVHLKWNTFSEVNNSGFEIERSNVKGQTSNEWTKISFVQGHGTTTSPNNYEFTDRNLASGKYNYRLKQIDFNGNYEYYNLSDEVVIGVPDKFSLEQNYPNPFNPNTVIRYSLSENSFVTLKVYNVIGNEVATLVSRKQNSGTYNYQFSTVNYQLSSGVYFYKIEAGSFSAVKRMVLIK